MVCPCNKNMMLEGLAEQYKQAAEVRQAEIERLEEQNRAYMLQAQDLRRRIEVLEVELDNERRARSAALDAVERLEHGVVIHSVNIPDWQDGAPTDQQLERWKWWAATFKDTGIVAGLSCGECSLRHGMLIVSMDALVACSVFQSAPIQPDLSNGPLWVPLEVAK